jgi:hypothetical protein
MGNNWRPNEFFIERMEFPDIWVFHFAIYSPLWRVVSSCRLLDCLGKGFEDYIWDRVVEALVAF